MKMEVRAGIRSSWAVVTAVDDSVESGAVRGL